MTPVHRARARTRGGGGCSRRVAFVARCHEAATTTPTPSPRPNNLAYDLTKLGEHERAERLDNGEFGELVPGSVTLPA
jgi:hypothetical protein